MNLEQYMKLAIEEAQISLREGNNGFGAVIVRDGKIIASSHDKEDTDHDPTSHAEINVVKEAGKILGRKLSECILISTHEPCPMCAYAIIWSGITTVAYGYSISEAISQKRKRINYPCKDVFDKTGVDIVVYANTFCVQELIKFGIVFFCVRLDCSEIFFVDFVNSAGAFR